MIITTHFLNKKIKSLAKNATTREHCYRSMDDIRYVLIMCEARDWKAIEPCIDTLKKKGKTVHVCVYTRKDEDTPIWDYAFLPVEEGKDVDMWGFPDKNMRTQLNNLTVDLLLDLTSEEVPVMRYLMLQHPSAFKVGAKREQGLDLFDLSIVMKDDVHDIPFLFRHIMTYLEAIRSAKSAG